MDFFKSNLLQKPITHLFFKNSFVNYVYAYFQFSKHGGYAQKICISNFEVYSLIKNLQQ